MPGKLRMSQLLTTYPDYAASSLDDFRPTVHFAASATFSIAIYFSRSSSALFQNSHHFYCIRIQYASPTITRGVNNCIVYKGYVCLLFRT